MPILQTADRVLAVVQLLVARGELSARQLSAELGTNQSTTYNLLETLLARGWAERAGDYRFRLTEDSPAHANSARSAQLQSPSSALWRLHEVTQETCYLTVLRGDEVSIIEIVEESSSNLRVAGLRVGFSGSEHVRAAGRVVLASLPDGEEWFSRLRSEHGADADDGSVVDAKELLESIRFTGVAVDASEFEKGIHCVAAPYFANDKVFGSIALSLPSARYDEKAELVHAEVRRAADNVTRIYSGG